MYDANCCGIGLLYLVMFCGMQVELQIFNIDDLGIKKVEFLRFKEIFDNENEKLPKLSNL